MKVHFINSLSSQKYLIRFISGGYRRSIILFISLFFLLNCRRASLSEFSVKSGPFRQSITETGDLEAIKASFITMPRLNWQYGYQFKVVGLVEHGKQVQKGDSIISLDASSIYKYILEKESSLENEQAASKKQKVDMENKLQELNAQLKTEQASYDLKKLELERVQYESENKRKLKELEFHQATIKLNKVKRNLDLRPKLDDYDRKTQEIRVIQRENEIKAAKETLKLMVIRSPLEGIFQVKTNWNGQHIKLGDNLYLGSMIASIPDIRKMKANTFVNETDITKVKLGTKVIVRLDALPTVPFNGVITSISKICTKNENAKIFKIEVEIPETDLRLKPGMTVSCEYLIFESEKELYVPNKCLLKENGHSYLLINKGISPQKIEVITGPSNNNYTVIISGAKKGQELLTFEQIQESKK
jgi:HlyD family secretion protein